MSTPLPFQNKKRIDALEIYSTEEQIVGKWIDGKTIYKKTIVVTNTALAKGDNYFEHNILNLKQVIKAELTKDGAHVFPYFNYNESNIILSMTSIAQVDSSRFNIRTMNDTWGSGNVWYATLYYTKTTN